jgi:hypothetical protein
MHREPEDRGELVAYYQVLCRAISFFEPMNWSHPAIQQWLLANGLAEYTSPWHLPSSALWVLVRSLEKKLAELQRTAIAPKLPASQPQK